MSPKSEFPSLHAAPLASFRITHISVLTQLLMQGLRFAPTVGQSDLATCLDQIHERGSHLFASESRCVLEECHSAFKYRHRFFGTALSNLVASKQIQNLRKVFGMAVYGFGLYDANNLLQNELGHWVFTLCL